MTSVELGVSAPAPDEGDELFVPAGTTVTFGSLEVARVRNPGARSVVALDVAVFREEPRPISRAFTTEDGISFQLLASASAAAAPVGRVALALERLRLGPSSQLPVDLSHGLTLTYVEAGTVQLRPVAGEVFRPRGRLNAVLHAWLVATHRHRPKAGHRRAASPSCRWARSAAWSTSPNGPPMSWH